MRIAILLFLVLLSSCTQNIEFDHRAVQAPEKPKIIIPERRFIKLEEIADALAKEGGLQRLRDFSLPDCNFEIRLWVPKVVGGRDGMSGLILKKNGEKYTAFNFVKMSFNDDLTKEDQFVFPKSDWQSVFRKINDAGVFTLPDSSELKNYRGDDIIDGFGYLVEFNKDGIYRIYAYSNPHWADNPEAKQIIKIGDIIADEFGLEEFRANPK